MKGLFSAVLAASVAMAAPAAAQTTAAGSPSAPIVNLWYVGANTGTAVVDKFGGVAGVEAGIRVWRNLDVVAEGVWITNAVNARQRDSAAVIARYLEQTQNAGVSGSVKVPAFYGGIGGRWVFEQTGRFRPYVLVTVGGAHTNIKPSFSLGGANVTGALGQYGVTLGRDLIGKYNDPAVGGGFGMLMAYHRWYFDVGARLIHIGGDNRSNASRLVLGGGYRF
jgi:hypothetical protein